MLTIFWRIVMCVAFEELITCWDGNFGLTHCFVAKFVCSCFIFDICFEF